MERFVCLKKLPRTILLGQGRMQQSVLACKSSRRSPKHVLIFTASSLLWQSAP